jgi:hypothetical protein
VKVNLPVDSVSLGLHATETLRTFMEAAQPDKVCCCQPRKRTTINAAATQQR